MTEPLEKRLNSGKSLILDGATGTELARRGYLLTSPGWSASAIREVPQLLSSIHKDYIDAGAEIITANTFRTHHRNLRDTKWRNDARALTQEAVHIAKEAAETNHYVAGSIAPLEDCYSPDLTPSLSELESEHRRMIDNLISAEVDLLLVETQITIREAKVIARLCQSTQIPFFISFACGRDGNLLSGESLAEAVKAVTHYSPAVLLVNCLPVEEVLPRLKELRYTNQEIRLGAYANTGRLMKNRTWETTQGINPAVYAEFAQRWKEFGIAVLGGCCGTTPKHISRISGIA